MNLGVSPLTTRIYAGKSKQLPDGTSEWVGVKTDVTDEAIRAVFEWFMYQHRANEPSEAFEVKFPNSGYVLTMTKDEVTK